MNAAGVHGETGLVSGRSPTPGFPIVAGGNDESETAPGDDVEVAGEADGHLEIGPSNGFSRYRDPVTQALGLCASTWETTNASWQQTLLRSKHAAPEMPSVQEHLEDVAAGLRLTRDKVGKKLAALLKEHPLWPWLEQCRGLRGTHVSRVVSMIGDPLRFPGRICADGHHLPSDWAGPCGCLAAIGEGKSRKWVPCGAEVGPVRRGTGVRSLWHNFGVHVVDGHQPRRRKGVQCTWNPAGRTALLMPDGIADQIVKQRTEPWRTIFDEQKERIARERGTARTSEAEELSGPSLAPLAEAVDVSEIDSKDGFGEGPADGVDEYARSAGRTLRPFQVHQRARVIAAKAFLGDLLVAWKGLVA